MQAKHILPLTGLRFFAATWVVAYHFWYLLFLLFPVFSLWIIPFFKLGYLAVPFFFLLSGFILSHNYFDSYSLSQHPRFIYLRFTRLWPVHCVTLVFMVVGPDFPLQINETGIPDFPLSNWEALKAFVKELFMVRYWHHRALLWNAPAWSVSVEWFAYLTLFPLAFICFRRIRSWLILAVLVMLFLILQSFLPLEKYGGKCGNIYFLFLAGSALYVIRSLVKNPPAEAIVIVGLLFFVAYLLLNNWLYDCIAYIAFALLIFGLSFERGLFARLLSTRLVVYGGLVSYSLYMTHFLVRRSYLLFFWQNLPESIVLRVVILLFTVGAIAGLALLTYHYVEEPANKKLRALQEQLHRRMLQMIGK